MIWEFSERPLGLWLYSLCWPWLHFGGTRYGTIATLTNFEVFDPNLECDNELLISQATNSQRAANEQLTTTKNDKNANNYYWNGRQPPERDVGQGKGKLKQVAKSLQAQPQESKVMSPEEHENISKMLKECQRKMEASWFLWLNTRHQGFKPPKRAISWPWKQGRDNSVNLF